MPSGGVAREIEVSADAEGNGLPSFGAFGATPEGAVPLANADPSIDTTSVSLQLARRHLFLAIAEPPAVACLALTKLAFPKTWRPRACSHDAGECERALDQSLKNRPES